MKNFKKSLFIASLAMAFTFGLFINESSSQVEDTLPPSGGKPLCNHTIEEAGGAMTNFCRGVECDPAAGFKGVQLAPCG